MRRPWDWLRQAESDFALAEQAALVGRFEWACFASQQGAEKAVKALHEAEGTEAWGHSVTLLVAPLPDVPDDVVEAAKALDKHYIAPRYPNAHPAGAPTDVYGRLDAERALGDATVILDFVRDRLPPA